MASVTPINFDGYPIQIQIDVSTSDLVIRPRRMMRTSVSVDLTKMFLWKHYTCEMQGVYQFLHVDFAYDLALYF